MITANACSIVPKIDCFLDYLSELDASIAFLTETWLSDTPELQNDLEDLQLGTGYGLICKNRPQNECGYSAVGVAIAFKSSQITFKQINLPDNNYELLFAVGMMPHFTKKFIAICMYMPPGLPVASVSASLTYLVDAILELKSRFKDPFICISGDFNGYKVQSYLDDYPDLVLVETGPTRGDRVLDLIYTNFHSDILKSGTLSPLVCDSGDGAASDHRVVFCTSELKTFEAYEWQTYTYMRQTDEGNSQFKEWLISQDWQSVFSAKGSNDKAVAYQTIINEAMNTCYPMITVKRKSSEDPWITDKIGKKIRQRKSVFKR